MKKILISNFFTTINFNMLKKVFFLLVNPIIWLNLKKGIYTKNIEKKILKYIHNKNYKNQKILSFYNARTALFQGLKILDIQKGDEIILQAYTCVSVVNSIISAGAKPIYVDIEYDTLNINPDKLQQLITKKTKAIIVQHTFGLPANIKQILDICKKNKLLLIEDCAHSFGAEISGKKVGIFGDISIFSFGRDKVLSTINGGFLLINNEIFFDNIKKNKSSLIKIPTKLLLKNIFYIPVSFFAYKLYNILSIGKIIIYLHKKLNLVPVILSNSEKKCEDRNLYYKYPNSLAYIGLSELDRVKGYSKHRKKISNFYEDNLSDFEFQKNNTGSTNLRFTIFVADAEKIYKKGLKNNIILGDWYRQVIAPKGVSYKKCFYHKTSCPIAEKRSKQTLNLPNHIGIKLSDAEKIVNFLKGTPNTKQKTPIYTNANLKEKIAIF